MDRDDLLNEMVRISKASQNPDQRLELDIQKIINQLRSMNTDKALVESVDELLHNPQVMTWERLDDVKPQHEPFTPNTKEIEFIRNLTVVLSHGAVWEVPRTGQKYTVDRKNKTFTLTLDTPHDVDNWHRKTSTILELLGWRMIDNRTPGRCVKGKKGDWVVTLVEFSIDNQLNTVTGKNFPPGSKGHDGMLMSMSHSVCLTIGHHIAKVMFEAALPDNGKAKSFQAGIVLQGTKDTQN